ncbi:MAG TPA: hypothetical protein VE781_11725 [Kineosporiaceae bacterium]|nr:hypothetical protein [Kineosporiaceae bacterium]
MSVTTGSSPRRTTRGAALRRDRSRREQLALLAELREVEHWRRLVAARLDLAVAAVARVDEPVLRSLAGAVPPPVGLRELLGVTGAPADVALLLRLREVGRDLDAYASALRASARLATADLVSRLDDHRPPSTAREAAMAAHPSSGSPRLAPVLPLRRPDGVPAGRPDDVA